MKKIFRQLILSALIFVPAHSILRAQSVQRLSATKANEYGLTYTLPLTELDITIEAEITSCEPGEFSKYATKYLNVSDPIMQPSLSATVKSVVVSTSGVPNKDEQYLIVLKGSNAPYIILDRQGIPLAINTETPYDVQAPELPAAVDAKPTPLETDAARQVITQEMLQSHSSAKRAQLAAEQIYALRQSRTDIITGQADQMPPDGAAMQLVLDNITAQEEALVAMFVGTKSVRTDVKTIRLIPQRDIADQIIARISAVDGIVDPTDLSGAPVYLSLKVVQRGELPVNEKGERLQMPKGGVAYCIPGKAEVDVTYDGKTYVAKKVDMAQFGVVFGMDPKNFTDKKAPVFLRFDPATGAAVEVGPARLE